MELAGAAVLVTGASSGIGAATARALGAAGARVGLAARRKELLDRVADEARAAGAADVEVWAVDLSVVDAAEQLARDAWERFGGLDGVVNNAGIPKRRHITELTFAEVEETMRVNFLAPVRITLTLLPLMRERGGGVVVNVASMAARVGPPRESAYAASKFALTGFSEVMAVDLWDEPVQVRVVQPGPIETPIWGDVPGNEPAVYTGPRYPAEDCATAIVEALTGGPFERFVPPEFGQVAAAKAQDVDTFLEGNAAFARTVES